MMMRSLTLVPAFVALAAAALPATAAPRLNDTGITACTAQGSECSDFVDQFFRNHRSTGLAVTLVVLVLPALIGIFWGAPLIARRSGARPDRATLACCGRLAHWPSTTPQVPAGAISAARWPRHS